MTASVNRQTLTEVVGFSKGPVNVWIVPRKIIFVVVCASSRFCFSYAFLSYFFIFSRSTSSYCCINRRKEERGDVRDNDINRHRPVTHFCSCSWMEWIETKKTCQKVLICFVVRLLRILEDEKLAMEICVAGWQDCEERTERCRANSGQS